MIGYAFADKEHREVVGEVVAVVHEQVVGLGSVDLFQRLQVLQYDLDGEICSSELNYLHRTTVMSGPSTTCLNALSEVVFYVVEDDRSVVNGVYLSSEELSRHASCKTLQPSVYIGFGGDMTPLLATGHTRTAAPPS